MSDSFNARGTLSVDGRQYQIHRLSALADRYDLARLPFSIKVLLENLLRHEDGETVRAADIEAVAGWDPQAEPAQEIAYRPARVLLQDFTGVPAVVDLAAMRDAMADLGGNPHRINPLQPAELVIDHSVQVDAFGSHQAFAINARHELERNRERYGFLRWGQKAFDNFAVVPPDTGIVHQVNLEYLARTVFVQESAGELPVAYPDTLVGTDSHTTMINGLGVLGWGVGGIEAEASMLGQPLSMLVPQVVGVRLSGELLEGTTATDLVLTVVEMLRRRGVVGKFVEFFGPGLAHLPLADRATIANMAPEYGATCGIFPIDAETLRYLRLTGRAPEQVALVEAYAREQGLFFQPGDREAAYSDVLDLDMGTVEPSLAGPKRPQDRVPLSAAKTAFLESLEDLLDQNPATTVADEPAHMVDEGGPVPAEEPQHQRMARIQIGGRTVEITDGAVVIAAITSCTNTSNPAVMLAAGLVARNAAARGLTAAPWVKTSLAPGSKVVTDYLQQAGLMDDLERLGFDLVGYGCTTCIGNSGPLPDAVSEAIRENDLVVTSVLSGNRNFEGRVHAEVKMNYLASPPLVVAYAIAGRMDLDLLSEPLGTGKDGRPVFLKDIWPSQREVVETEESAVRAEHFAESYADVFAGDESWNGLAVPEGDRYTWPESTYIRKPPFFAGMGPQPTPAGAIEGARVLALLGDSVTTDHISPAGSIPTDSPAGEYLVAHGVDPLHFNSYGSRRGNHEVMMRGTFANVRLRNQLAPGTEGGWTVHLPAGEQTTIFDAAERYRAEGVPLIVLAGKEYGSGSSRDWAAKGPRLLGVRAVIAESFERIHRSNLVGMGILPLEFEPGQNPASLGLTGRERYAIEGLGENSAATVTVTATPDDGGQPRTFTARVRLDTPKEVEYFRHGGILQYVLRSLV
jgi:aconitate hydratase